MIFLFFKALFGLLAFDTLGFAHNFSRIHSLVKDWKTAPHTPAANAIERACNAINYACAWYPKRVRCLQRSMVATCLLRSCGVPAQMVLGAQKTPFKAHAWTEVDGRAINERRDVQNIYGVWDRI